MFSLPSRNCGSLAAPAVALLVIIAAVVQPRTAVAQTSTEAEPKVLEETFSFPPLVQWRIPFVGADVSVIGVAWGPADSPEMISKGRVSPFGREKPAFFPDRPYALAIHLQLVAARPTNTGTLSGLVRVKDVEANVEHPMALTPSGFMPVNVGFQFTGNTRLDYWEFFPVSPEEKDFLFQVISYQSDPPLSFRIIVNGNKLAVVKASPSGGAATLKFTRNFAGTVGPESAIKVQLTANGSELSGTEEYVRVGRTLWLRGALDSLGNFRLREYYPQDQLTGIFDGKFSENYREMTGYFSKPDGSRLQPFELKEAAAQSTR